MTNPSSRVLAEPAKLAKLYACSDYDLRERRLPAGCDWYGAAGLGRIEVQLALASSILLGIIGLLLWWRRLRGAAAGLVLTGAGLLGLALDVAGAADDASVLPGIALVLMGMWWVGLGVLLRRRHRGFAAVSTVLGVVALLGAFDKLVYLVPYLPVGPEWVRGLLATVWFLWALVLVLARTPRHREDETPSPAVAAHA